MWIQQSARKHSVFLKFFHWIPQAPQVLELISPGSWLREIISLESDPIKQDPSLVLFLTLASFAGYVTTQSPAWVNSSTDSVWKVILRGVPSSCYSGGAALFTCSIRPPPALLANQSEGYIQRDAECWNRSRWCPRCVQGDPDCVRYPQRTGRFWGSVPLHSGWSRSNLSFALSTCLSWVPLLSLWAYCPAWKMGAGGSWEWLSVSNQVKYTESP